MAETTKRKNRKRKQIQHGGIIEFGEGAALVAESAAAARTVSKRARVSSKEPSQVNGTAVTVEGLGTTPVRARKMQKKILYQMQVDRELAL